MDELYSLDILALSASLKDESLAAPCASVRKISKLCGSEVELDLQMESGLVTACAMRVRACALGQAASAIIRTDIIGASAEEIFTAQSAFTDFLKSGGPKLTGRFARLNALEGVKTYPARHTSTLLAINAAADAVKACQQS